MSNKLKNMMSVYSDIWVDVLYNKRLHIHLRKVEHDIAFIGLLILRACTENRKSDLLLNIKKELKGLSDIIKKKIEHTEQLK